MVLLGGKDDIQNSALIAKGAGDNVTDLSGKLSLNGSAWVISKSSVVVTPDTGLMHIAAAFQKNIVSLWGNTIPEFGMYPYVDKGKRIEMEVKGLKCRPCTKIGFKKCPKKHFRCMNDIPVQKVIEAIANLADKK